MARGRKKAQARNQPQQQQLKAAVVESKPQQQEESRFPLPEGVTYINVRIPVYTGQVREDQPIRLEQLAIRLLSREHKRGVNRVHMAIRQMAKRDETMPVKDRELPPYMNSRTEAARYVFALIDQAFKEQVE